MAPSPASHPAPKLAAGGALVTKTVAVAGWPFDRRDAQQRATTCPGRAATGWTGQDRSSTTPLTIRYTPRMPNAVIMISRWWCQTRVGRAAESMAYTPPRSSDG